jgi:hypothetical protein
MRVHVKRHPMSIRLSLGCDAEGTLLGHANETVYFELRRSNGPVNPLDYLR